MALKISGSSSSSKIFLGRTLRLPPRSILSKRGAWHRISSCAANSRPSLPTMMVMMGAGVMASGSCAGFACVDCCCVREGFSPVSDCLRFESFWRSRFDFFVILVDLSTRCCESLLAFVWAASPWELPASRDRNERLNMVAVLGKMDRRIVTVLTGHPAENFRNCRESDQTDEKLKKRERRGEGRNGGKAQKKD